ncbi:hypothetical protein MU852_06580 [Brevundimonas albigilva]|uniref:hypothetical protein n=1 Tax=Brevundimonas albigilva TaxID=1312364 RepID=UPI00201B8903|nr:hypothetical protein [Brevundimonas albigilva]UQV19439.1 hypothetical protein MU852_06580 [Brevundimonas albigilva]
MNRRGTPMEPPNSWVAPGCMMMTSARDRSMAAVNPLPMPMNTPVMARTSNPDSARAMTAAM